MQQTIVMSHIQYDNLLDAHEIKKQSYLLPKALIYLSGVTCSQYFTIPAESSYFRIRCTEGVLRKEKFSAQTPV